jgi:hypothetical protein
MGAMSDPSTPVDLAALRADYASRVPGWVAPTTWALVIDGEISVVNQPGGKHGLSALSLAVPLGHDGSTATLAVTAAQAAEALDLLTPAAVDTSMRHPNLEAFRRAAAGGHELYAVFVRDLADPVSSDLDARLRADVG